jgi:hypothetical protein
MLGWSNLALCQRSTWNCVDEQESGVLASARHLLGRKLTRDEKELSRLNRDGWYASLTPWSATITYGRDPEWAEIACDRAAVHVKVDFKSRKRFRKQALLAASRNELCPSIDQPVVQ